MFNAMVEIYSNHPMYEKPLEKTKNALVETTVTLIIFLSKIRDGKKFCSAI